jgi:hypothetical protein
MIELGDRVKDQISGYVGITVAITDWIYGCRRLMVQGEALSSDGKPVDIQSFDEPQLTIVDKGVMKPLQPSRPVVTPEPEVVYRPMSTGGAFDMPSRRPNPSRL